RTSNLGYRGRAAAAWGAGADGVYLFNLFDPQSPVWREAGDPELLATLDKDYFACPRGVGKAAGGNLPYAEHRTLETLNPHDPKKLSPAEQVTATVHLGEPADP